MRRGVFNSEKFEYIKQPHILLLVVLGLLVIVGAFTTAFFRLRHRAELSQLPTDQACVQQIGDENLCRFAAASEKSHEHSYRSVATETNANGTLITTVDYETSDRISSISQVNGVETGAFMLIDADGYARDYENGDWVHFHDEAFEPTTLDDSLTSYDFTSSTSEDVIEFRDQYEPRGTEPCGDLTCFKYQVILDENSEMFIWFDDKDYLLRRHQTTTPDATSNMQYDYREITLTPPANARTVTEEEFTALLEVE